MEVKLLDLKKTQMRIEILDSDETIVFPLLNQLLKDKDVSDARYVPGHPQLDNPQIFLRVKKGRPQTVFRRVARELSKEFAQCKTLIDEKTK
ncbi:MAG: RpoL/Rpb11 RNA polymerase subunit family protein [Thermoplasmata archaeon]|jgi:DNA-directed RNA polymerase subunit L